MKRLHRIAALLYPRWWRERYGDEFEALLDDSRPGMSGFVDIVKGALFMHAVNGNSVRILGLCLLGGIVVSVGANVFLEKTYRSRALVGITLDDPSVDVTGQINAMAQRVLNRSSLTRVVRAFPVYRRELSWRPLEDVIQEMRADIRIRPVQDIPNGSPAFLLEFDYPDAQAAQAVLRDLVSRFMDEAIRQRYGELRNGTTVPAVELAVLDPATLPERSIRSSPAYLAVTGIGGIAAAAFLCAAVIHVRRRCGPSGDPPGDSDIPDTEKV